jgi:uncharacterized protein (TIGR04255 family)
MTLKYKNPPINELVIGVYFDRDIASLRPEYVGVFWNRYRSDFPTITQQAPVARPISLFDPKFASIELPNMPRYWLESADGTSLIQLQANAFLVNWRRRNSKYPHFDAVKDFFDASCRNFFRFIEEELHESAPRVQLSELNYVNSIEPCEYWSSPLDTPKVLPRFALPVPTNNDLGPADFQQATLDRITPDTMLQTTVRSGRSLNDLTKPVLVFELRALGLIADNDGINEWFHRAHDLTGRRFTEMTNPEIQTIYWQPE